MSKPADSDWAWTGGGHAVACGLIFVRDTSIETVIEALGLDPAQARPLPESPGEEVLRVGQSGDWTFAIDATVMLNIFKVKDAVRELSRGGAAAWCMYTPNIDTFRYLEDGIQVTLFDLVQTNYRSGAQPDRFVPQMRQVGLDIDRAKIRDPYRRPYRDNRICVLEMLTLALGLRVPAEIAQGPLPAVQIPRTHG